MDAPALSLRLPARLPGRDVHPDAAEPGRMTPVAEILRDEIRRSGPISFHRFMDAALYHPEFGYYRRPRDPFGTRGDFYTAEQLQPVFGILIAERIRQLRERMGAPPEFTVVEAGAGRREMAEAFRDFPYI